MGVRPALVRPSAGVLPGSQAPLPGNDSRGDRGRVRTGARGRNVGQCRQILCGRTCPGHAAALLQLHGGIGVTWEHDLHLFLRRVTLYRSMFGTPEEHNLRVYALTKELESAS